MKTLLKILKAFSLLSLPLFSQRKMGTYARADINFPGEEKRHIEGNQDRVSTGDQEIRMSEKLPKV
jgi:hypothetical protein